MQIVSAETSIVEIPFPPAGDGTGIMPVAWKSVEFALVRLEDELGNVGWGEGFGYFTVDATKSIIDRLILPRVINTEIDDIRAWNARMQVELHLHGRYGITIFALSSVDIALWDLAAKRAGLPLKDLIDQGQTKTAALRNYASLMRYGGREQLLPAVEDALSRGYDSIKLHETEISLIQAARDLAGPTVPISIDVNCRWSTKFVREHRDDLLAIGPSWLEEPIFPPENFAAMADLRSPEIPLGAGENWCTSFQFEQSADAVDIWQPSITKVGGVSEYLNILDRAKRLGKSVIPHCPYFGPGFFATVQLAAAHEIMNDIEILFADPEAWLAPLDHIIDGNRVRPTSTPGIGFEPNPDVFVKFRRA